MANASAQHKVWFITGCSTGFGRLLAEQLLASGVNVVATARKVDQLSDFTTRYPENVKILSLDVTSQSSVDGAVDQALAHFGRIDVLVNNAGYGLVGAVEEATESEFRPMFETNVFGLIRVTKAVIPHLRKQCSGTVVNISSIGGLVGGPGWGYYNATKFAVEGLTQALAAELAPLGVHVMAVEPGPFRTDFLGRSGIEAKAVIPDYVPTARVYFNTMAGKQPGDPVRAAQAIIAAVNAPQPPRHLVLGKVALTRFRGLLDQWKTELDQWETTTLGADFPEGE